MRFPRTRRGARLVSTLLAFVGVASACASCASTSPATSRGSSISADARLRASLPAALRRSGVLRIATDASYAPAESFGADGRTIIGFDPDLGDAIGKELGLRTKFVAEDFSTLLTRVGDGRADLIMSAMTDTAAREKQADFVDYFQTGAAIVVQRGNPAAVSDLATLCGLPVAVESDSTEASLLDMQQQRCGAHPIQLHDIASNAAALLLLRTGRVRAFLVDYPQATLLANGRDTGGLYQLATNQQFDPAPYGIAVARTDPALRDAVRGALAELMRSGRYAAILRKWLVSDGALHLAGVNQGGTHPAK